MNNPWNRRGYIVRHMGVAGNRGGSEWAKCVIHTRVGITR